MNLILSVVFLLMSVIGFTQTSHQFQVLQSGVVDFKVSNNSWYASVQNLEMPSPEGNSDKAKLLRLKRDLELKYPRKKPSKLSIKSSAPEVFDISGFEGNAYNNRVPNDNSMAISDAGILMSCTNNRVVIYDTQADTLMDTGFLQDFVLQFNVTASRYDPKMIYDPNEDKFILTFLVGTNHVNSKIAVCFQPLIILWMNGMYTCFQEIHYYQIIGQTTRQ